MSTTTNDKQAIGTGTGTSGDPIPGMKEYLPISGPELAQIIIGWVAGKVVAAEFLGECLAYPGAKVSVALRIEPQPLEEGRRLELNESTVMDFSRPPDVMRILSGLPIWEKIKISLDGMEQIVERPVEAPAAVEEAARKVAGLGQGGAQAKPSQPSAPAKPSTATSTPAPVKGGTK